MSESKNTRKTGQRFAPGNNFGKGRPVGSRNRATLALLSLLESEGETITRKAVEMAKAGDTTALRLVIERLIPPARDRHVNLALPKMATAADVTGVMGAVLQAVAAGEITPNEGQSIAALIEAQRKAIETLDLEARLASIEQAIHSKAEGASTK